MHISTFTGQAWESYSDYPTRISSNNHYKSQHQQQNVYVCGDIMNDISAMKDKISINFPEA